MSTFEQMRERDDTTSAFTHELQVRILEANTSLHAAEALGDTLLASIAASDLADMRALAARNDIDPDVEL